MNTSALFTHDLRRFPRTRYQGSKRKLAGAILRALDHLSFDTVLDAFGGTAAMSHAFKSAGKAVTYNDILAFNLQIGLALIENDCVQLDESIAAAIGTRRSDQRYGDFIANTFSGIYFTDDENEWLDTAVANIRAIEPLHARAVAWFALFQAALAKRPYNLFHRRNLYMRQAVVPRGFGNKTTWERPFGELFRRAAREAGQALVHGGGRCRALCADALTLDPSYDLVYIDPPYINGRGNGVDYRDWYHFLEGLVRYDDWPAMVDTDSRHRRLLRRPDPWSDPRTCEDAYRALFSRYRDAIIVVSYRSRGIPGIERLADLLRTVKRDVHAIDLAAYQYALSTDRNNREMLLIGIGC